MIFFDFETITELCSRVPYWGQFVIVQVNGLAMNGQYHFTYANLSLGFTVCYHDKNSLCNQNNRSNKQLSQRQPSVAVTLTVFNTWQYRLPLPSWCADAFSLTTLWEGSTVTGNSLHKGQVMQSVYIFFVVILNKLLNKQPGCIWIFMKFIEYLISPPIFFQIS